MFVERYSLRYLNRHKNGLALAPDGVIFENNRGVKNHCHGDRGLVSGKDHTPRVLASDLQARSPKYVSVLNHLYIYLAELDFEETSTYVTYGAGAFLAGWILSAVVSAIDSIPLFPKVLEIVGLGYTIWFSTRYLLYKENRDELLVKVEDLKRRIIGSGDV